MIRAKWKLVDDYIRDDEPLLKTGLGSAGNFVR